MSVSSLIVCLCFKCLCPEFRTRRSSVSCGRECCPTATNSCQGQGAHSKGCICNVGTDLLHVQLQEEQLQSKDRELAQNQQQLRQKVNCHVTVM